MMPKTHEMILEDTFPTGAQLWTCPVCNRMFIMQWPPDYKRIMLDEGDATVVHTGQSDGRKFSHHAGGKDDPRLAPWIDAMDKIEGKGE